MADSRNKPAPGTPPDPQLLDPAFRRLCEVVAHLRSEHGCPWDREQTLDSIKPFTLEETYELLEAIDSADDNAIVDELGDVLLQVLLDAQIGADEGRFSLIDVVTGLTDKLVRRHPHVFGDDHAETATDVIRHWDNAKQKEKPRESVFDGIPLGLPALLRTLRLTKRAAEAGYDFPQRSMLFDKLREEIEELARELFADGRIPDVPATVDAEIAPDEPVDDPVRKAQIENELGDILFVVANMARRWHVNPEDALRNSNRKFARRFQHIEQRLKQQGRGVRSATLREMEDLYQEAKRMESARPESPNR